MKSKFKLMGLLMCFVAASAMVSCTDDNNENETGSASIVGTWGCVHSYEHNWGYYMNGGEEQTFDEEETDGYKGDVVNFKEDGSYTSSRDFGPFDDKGGSWMINGNNLIIDREDCEVISLNNNTLKIHYLWVSGESEFGQTHDEYILEFKRQ